MAEFKLGRIRFVWKGGWTAETVYYKDDVIRYGGKTYICSIGHTSNSDFNTDLEAVPTKWDQMSDGQEWKDEWTTDTFYKINDVVKYGGLLYICNDSHTSASTTSAGLENDQAKWDLFADGVDWKNSWTISTRYKVGDIVKYGGYTYICKTGHTSTGIALSGLESDILNWEIFNPGLEYKGSWATTTRYKINDVVKYGAGLWICTTAHTSTGDFPTDSANWSQFVEGFEFENDWSNITAYQPGDVVRYGGNQYVSKTNNTDSNPLTVTDDWSLFAEGFRFQDDWSISTSYKVGEVVRVNGYTYLAKTDSPSTVIAVTASNNSNNLFTAVSTTGLVANMAVQFSGSTFGNVFPGATYYIKTVDSGTTFTISTTPGGAVFVPTTDSGAMAATVGAHPTNATYWDRLNSGVRWQGEWQDDTEYEAGDAIRFGSNAYICIQKHRSEQDDGSSIIADGGGAANSRPDQDVTGTYWNLLAAGSEVSVLTTRGDLVYYGGAGPTRLPIGVEGQVLQAGAEDPEWVSLGASEAVYYVGPHGVDSPAPVYGLTIDKPWASIRYACEQVDSGPRNSNAKLLLEMNREFIRREATEWIKYQVNFYTNTTPTPASIWYEFDYEDYVCERDMGFTIDALIHDISHGGNVKIRGVANALVGAITEDSPGAYPNIEIEKDQSIAAYNYMKSVIEDVLNQTAPDTNYQVTNGDNSTAIIEQFFDTTITTESNVIATVTNLMTIVTNAIEDEDASRVPARYAPNNLIIVKTGRYREILPIMVPAETCVIGDEVRSVNSGPAGSVVSEYDSKYSLESLTHLETVVSDVIAGNTVTPTIGNNTSQSIDFPFADTVEQDNLTRLVRAIQQNIDYRVGRFELASYPNPTDYNTSYLIGYGDARNLIKENKKFFQEEIIAYIAANYSSVKYSKTKCRQDVGYIVDALAYDLTYGGKTQTINAARAYYDGANLATRVIDSQEVQATIAAYEYLKTLVEDVATNTVVSALQATVPQYRDTAGSAGAATFLGECIDIIVNVVENGISSLPNTTITQIASNVCTTSTNHGLQVGDTVTPRTSAHNLVAGTTYYVATVPNTDEFTLSATLGGSTFTLANSASTSVVCDITYRPATTWVAGALTTAAQTLINAGNSIIENVIDDLNAIAWHTDFKVRSAGLTNDDFTVYVGKNSIAHTYVSGGKVTKSNGSVLTITNFVYNETTGVATVTTSIDHGLAINDVVDIEDIIVSCLSSGGSPSTFVYPSATSTDGLTTKVKYNQNKCIRDIRYIVDGVAYDFSFDSNFQTIKNGYAYLRSSASEVFTLGQKAVTRSALGYAKDQALLNVGGNATAQTRITSLMQTLDDIIYTGSTEGTNCATGIRNADYAVLQLERNRSFIVSEVTAYIVDAYKDTATATTASDNSITISDTSWLQRNAAVKFSADIGGTPATGDGILADTTYYVQKIISSTKFTVATTRYATSPLALIDDTGSISVVLDYNSASCERDVNAYIDALKYDLKYPGNYKSLLAARYYGNAVKGSLEEDMYYLRNATGIRNQTLDGLTGDLLSENKYGTSRVSAGAYCSLDPGWGPDDYRTWILTRSPYVQNVTTFGYAAVGQKIDGAIHAGGNDSIVSNDFTQVISDGIGAWITNNGRAELVSVFSYYAHIGYLAENGGRIRGTNGNNSYGDWGSVAEGFDDTETPNSAMVDNRFQFNATVDSVFTDNDETIWNLEFSNAGSEYTEASWNITGAGTGAIAVADEFRDDAVFQVHLLDNVDDSTEAPEADGNFGGIGYISNANTAQGGTSSSITIAATDSELSSAYVGMKVILTGGTGAGQIGIIDSYNSGTKIANVVKESTGASGWDHIEPGTSISSPDASTTYVIEPRITIASPGFSSGATSLPSTGTWTSVVYGDTVGEYTGLTADSYSGTDGSEATFTVIRNGSKYVTLITAGGVEYNRLETITITGDNLGGTTPTNDLVITITSINSLTGEIIEVETDGFGTGGNYVAVKSGTTNASYSTNGETWTASTLPSSSSWSSVASGIFDDDSTAIRVSRFVAIASGTGAAAYSADGVTWSATTMPISSNWTAVAFGEERFVAISNNSTTVAISQDGEAWDITGALPGTGYTDITYGKGMFVAVKGSSNEAATSPDGVTWTARTLPATSAWTSVAWGRGKFVAVASDSNNGAFSLDGTTWTAMAIDSPDSSSPMGLQQVRYGQGLFMATVYLSGITGYSYVLTSEDGITWTSNGVEGPGGPLAGYGALAFGNPNRTGYWVALVKDSGDHIAKIRTGATAKARAFVAQNKIFAIRMIEPGSGYDTTPTLTITDPNNIFEAPVLVRVGKGALANPTFISKGTGYESAGADILTGNGYADFFQTGQFIAVRRLTQEPTPGSNVVFSHLPDQTFKLVNVLTFLGTNDGSYTAFFQISPNMSLFNAPDHGVTIETRIRYSQVRLTGHDFLDIGTGNFVETNYPGQPTQDAIQTKETRERNGGRVFYTSTDQDGNFRVGNLFTIEQSTGIATLNADAFNIAGLQELSLGEVTLGGGSASIEEFSTDPFFTADSDTIVPTQRAIKAYISSQIGGGGASLNVNSVTAGFILINGTQITTTTGAAIKMNATFDFRGGVIGLPAAWSYFLN